MAPSAPLSPLRVRVPASTSNLGPGFDLLGLALSLYLEVELCGRASGGGHELVAAEGEAAEWPRATNLVFAAFDRAARELGLCEPALSFAARSEIPLARGLGSSGAAVAAGLLLASALAPRAARLDELVRWGAELEGHPDNSTASLCGGCTLAAPVAGGVRVVRQELSPELVFAVAWPSARVSTHSARGVLPRAVAFADAVENPRRLALLLEGLRRGERELVALGTADRLHVERRLALIPGGDAAITAALGAGAWAATISGSGSALIAISSALEAEAVAAALAAGLEDEHVEARVLRPVLDAPRVEPPPDDRRGR